MSDKPIFFQPYGLARGFQLFVTSDEDALAWWDSYEGRPRLLFMHLWDIHHPYGMPWGPANRGDYPARVEAWKERLRGAGIQLPAPQTAADEVPDRAYVAQMQVAWHNERGFKTAMEDYIAGVETFDRRRLKALAAAVQARQIASQHEKGTLMVITADHGEGRDLPPSQLAKHGTTLKDDQIRIPLFMHIPGMAGGRRIASQVSQADIAPAILDVLGLLGARTSSRTPYGGQSLLPLLRGETRTSRPVYAETSTVFRDPTLPAEGRTSRPNPRIRYRIMRYPDRKYWLVGKSVTWNDDLLAVPAEQFVRALFEDGLGRHPGSDELAQWQSLAQAAPPSDLARRKALVQRFEQSGEFKRLPKYTIFDLQRDPLETSPRDARQSPAGWSDYQGQLAAIVDIDRAGRPGEPLVSSEADEQIILRRLQGLGYVE